MQLRLILRHPQKQAGHLEWQWDPERYA